MIPSPTCTCCNDGITTVNILNCSRESEVRHMEPVIVVHGGAGTHAAIELGHVTRKDMQDGVKAAASAGYRKLCDGGSAVDAVEAAVMYMEKDPAFNAGQPQSLATVFIIIFVFPSPRPLSCINSETDRRTDGQRRGQYPLG